MKQAAILGRKGCLFVHPWAVTTEGVGVALGPCVVLPVDCEDRELRSAVRAALEGSRIGVPHPKRWDDIQKPFLRLAGVKTWAAFMLGASHVDVVEDGGHITLIPSRNLGPKAGFEPIPTGQVVLESSSPMLCRSIRELLAENT